MQTTTQHTKLNYTLMVPTNQPFEGPPVTPYDTYNQTVHLPIHTLPTVLQSQPNYTHHKTLMEQFHTMLTTWQRPLFGLIHHMQPNQALLEVSQAGDTISLISNASVQKTKQSGFAWTIAHKTRTLWWGVGLAPGHKEDIYVGRAEAFGLIAGLTFLKYYLECYGHALFSESPLHCFCNNLGVITNVSKLLMPHILCPNDTTTDDWDIYMVLSTLAIQRSPHCNG